MDDRMNKDNTMQDSKKRFSNRVGDYVRYRPSYPGEAIEYLYTTVGFNAKAVIADVGAGTGIFTALLLERGSRVIAVEPNAEMRTAAITSLGKHPRLTFSTGSAEQTELPDHCADFIVSAQAFHWFDHAATKQEFQRIIRPGGKAVLIWNKRLTSGSLFLEGYEQLLQDYGTDYTKVDYKNVTDETLHKFFKNGTYTKITFTYRQLFDYDGLRGRLSSSSYAPSQAIPTMKL
ncbi:class I SAM-dependent methyltransferase [Paenibacillus senegalensis]|uniref:class I SAM-dependent methyltransferase n=1 Tax=Paenibacillus senegalensis TaxID=1465766 RepID=UPI000287B4A1|nr:methyltransferase domain-containing protein [Paenibacillus senegalensis]